MSNQRKDEILEGLIQGAKGGRCSDFGMDGQGALRTNRRLCVPDMYGQRQEVFLNATNLSKVFIQEFIRCIET